MKITAAIGGQVYLIVTKWLGREFTYCDFSFSRADCVDPAFAGKKREPLNLSLSRIGPCAGKRTSMSQVTRRLPFQVINRWHQFRFQLDAVLATLERFSCNTRPGARVWRPKKRGWVAHRESQPDNRADRTT